MSRDLARLLQIWWPFAKAVSRAPADSIAYTEGVETARNDWRKAEIRCLMLLPFADLMLRAQLMHRTHHNPGDTEIGTLQRLLEYRAVQHGGALPPLGAALDMRSGRDERVNALYRLATMSRDPREICVTAGSSAAGFTLSPEFGRAREFDGLELVRTVAVARIVLPTSKIRIASSRSGMSEALHTLCFFAGANLIFLSDDQPRRRPRAPTLIRKFLRPTKRSTRI